MNEKSTHYHLRNMPFLQFQVYVLNTQAATRENFGMGEDYDLDKLTPLAREEKYTRDLELFIAAARRKALQFPPEPAP